MAVYLGRADALSVFKAGLGVLPRVPQQPCSSTAGLKCSNGRPPRQLQTHSTHLPSSCPLTSQTPYFTYLNVYVDWCVLWMCEMSHTASQKESAGTPSGLNLSFMLFLSPHLPDTSFEVCGCVCGVTLTMNTPDEPYSILVKLNLSIYCLCPFTSYRHILFGPVVVCVEWHLSWI